MTEKRKEHESDHGAGLAAAVNDTGSSTTETASGFTIPPVDGPVPMVAPTFDESGDYPSDETLQAIRNWPASQINACLEFARAAWHWENWATEELRPHEREMVHAEEGQRFLRLATGGWSGNEEIVGALNDNMWARHQWCLSASGGLHIYEFKRSLAADQLTTEVSSPTAASSAPKT